MTRALRLGAAAAIALAVVPARAPAAPADALARGAEYLVSFQRADGSFGEGATADQVAEWLASLVAARAPHEPVARAYGFVRARGAERARGSGGWAGRVIMGVVAAGGDPRDVGGQDLVAILRAHRDPLTGELDATSVYAHALAMLGFVAAREPVPADAVTFLRANECRDGGFSHRKGCLQPADVDTTAIATTALAHAAPDDPALGRARAFLRAARTPDGGFGYAAGEETNANSTGLALSALAALGEDPSRAPWAVEGRGPVEALLALQAARGGFAYQDGGEPNAYATVQALPGLAGIAYPVEARAPSASASRTPDASARAERDQRPTGTARPGSAEPAVARTPSTREPVAAPAVTAPVEPAPASRAPWIGGAAAALALAAAALVARMRRAP